MRSFGKLGTRVLGTAAGILVLFLVVGFLLPARWEADRTIVIAATPEQIFPYLDSPRAWRSWTPWPDSGLVWQGPTSGVGARVTWNNPNVGDGAFEIVEAKAPSLVRYRVAVQHGTVLTQGTLRLVPDPDGTRVSWTERGNLGHNPLMGYWALAMKHAQGRELEKDLVELAKVLGDSNPRARSAASPKR